MSTQAVDNRVSTQSMEAGTEPKQMPRPSITKDMLMSTSRLKVRRKSYGFQSSIPIVGQSTTRGSQVVLEFRRPLLIYLPTYQLEPQRPFKEAAVQQVVEAVVDELCPMGYNYSPDETPSLVMTMAQDIMRAVKAMNFDRYKIIAVVTIGQKRSQSYNNTVSFLWDGNFDRYVDVHRLYTTSIIQVTVFGIYLD